MEVCPLSREVMLRITALNLYPLDYRAAYASSIIHTRSPVGLPCGSLSLNREVIFGEGELRAYHVSCERQSGLGLASPPVAQRLRRVS